MLFSTHVDIDIDEITYKLTKDGYTDEAKTLIVALIGQADETFDITLQRQSTLEADVEEFKEVAEDIVERLEDRQKIVARAFLTALLAELGDA
jgi:hypothetical protein